MSLLFCPECHHTVSDKAYACPGCGYPISHSVTVIPPKPPAKRRRKKLPNGYGCIKKLSGNRTRPYAAYPPASDLLAV